LCKKIIAFLKDIGKYKGDIAMLMLVNDRSLRLMTWGITKSEKYATQSRGNIGNLHMHVTHGRELLETHKDLNTDLTEVAGKTNEQRLKTTAIMSREAKLKRRKGRESRFAAAGAENAHRRSYGAEDEEIA